MAPLSVDQSFDEQLVRDLVQRGEVRDAAQHVLAHHGAAFYGYIVKLTGDDTLAADAFQLFSVRLWQGLPAFRWESSLKSWAYSIARNATYRTLQDPHRKRGERLATADEEALVAQWTRSSTERWRETGPKEALWRAVDALDPEDRELLLLRLGQRMSWREVATVLLGEDADDSARTKAAARARKRFERLKAQLREVLEA